MSDRMTGLFIDISDYVTDPIEEEMELEELEKRYRFIPSVANNYRLQDIIAGRHLYMQSRTRPREANGRFKKIHPTK